MIDWFTAVQAVGAVLAIIGSFVNSTPDYASKISAFWIWTSANLILMIWSLIGLFPYLAVMYAAHLTTTVRGIYLDYRRRNHLATGSEGTRRIGKNGSGKEAIFDRLSELRRTIVLRPQAAIRFGNAGERAGSESADPHDRDCDHRLPVLPARAKIYFDFRTSLHDRDCKRRPDNVYRFDAGSASSQGRS